jgi:hypothetical protein
MIIPLSAAGHAACAAAASLVIVPWTRPHDAPFLAPVEAVQLPVHAD